VAMNSLTFERLAFSNLQRCGEAFHPIDDWTPTDWATAAAGELGEACNKIKKARRTNYANLANLFELNEIAFELADAVIYIDLLATRLSIDLGEAIRTKFNITSVNVGSSVKL
jgi:NTP pyrophosphatase (non-canonical NTP hydrolase)